MTRLVTALAIIAALALVLALPWQAFFMALMLVALLAWSEYVGLSARVGTPPPAVPGALLVLALVSSFVMPRSGGPLTVLLLATVLAAAGALREGWRDPGAALGGLASSLAGLVWIGMLLGAQVGIRITPAGPIWLILLYATVAAGDSAAYYGGSALGRHKLAPELSPNKTVEGTLFGLAGSAAAAVIVARWLPALAPGEAVVLGLVLGAVGQAGDLIESALKRAAGVKDSSDLLPGHGGVLDRIDAHLPAGGVLFCALRSGWLG